MFDRLTLQRVIFGVGPDPGVFDPDASVLRDQPDQRVIVLSETVLLFEEGLETSDTNQA
jgi:hypothetical protein